MCAVIGVIFTGLLYFGAYLFGEKLGALAERQDSGRCEAEGQGLVYDRIHRTVADGQFVLTHSEGSVAGVRHSYAELWHLSDGVLTEMWDAVTEVPADAEALHDHGIF